MGSTGEHVSSAVESTVRIRLFIPVWQQLRGLQCSYGKKSEISHTFLAAQQPHKSRMHLGLAGLGRGHDLCTTVCSRSNLPVSHSSPSPVGLFWQSPAMTHGSRSLHAAQDQLFTGYPFFFKHKHAILNSSSIYRSVNQPLFFMEWLVL